MYLAHCKCPCIMGFWSWLYLFVVVWIKPEPNPKPYCNKAFNLIYVKTAPRLCAVDPFFYSYIVLLYFAEALF